MWTVPIPDDAVVVSRGGKRLDVSVQDLPVIDATGPPTSLELPATVSFQITWRATSARQRAGRGSAVAATDPKAFLGRLSHARTRGTFSGAAGGFTFQSDQGAPARTVFAVMGTEQSGALLPGIARCDLCAQPQPTAPEALDPW